MSACCYDSEPSELFREEYRRARKNYKCCECGVPINPGDVYQQIVLLDASGWGSYRTCVLCADLRDSLEDITCVYLEGLGEAYHEHLKDIGAYGKIREGTHAARLLPNYFLYDEEEDGAD